MSMSICNIPSKDIYKSYQSPEIKRFIKSSKLYKKKGWSLVKKVAKGQFHETDLYEPIENIIHAILQHFHTDDSHSRRVVNTNQTAMKHIEDGYAYFKPMKDGSTRRVYVKTSPDLSILGNGPYFIQDEDNRPGYDHCVAPIEIKRQKDVHDPDLMIQLEEYSRQCFLQQPSRRYVPCVVITENKLVLFIYDRSGWICSRHVDIHQDAESFVRIIIGISSIDDNLRNSPFDHRVTWYQSMSGDGVETTATALPVITLLTQKHEEYRVTKKLFQRLDVFGRGTICWRTESEIEGCRVKVLIKECWRPAKRPAEFEFMDTIKGLAGVGQILAYDVDERSCRISQFHDFVFKDVYDPDPYAHDRIFSRIMLKEYGKPLECFKNKVQLLEAFRDAVAGHKRLWLSGILHRDVSIDNILLGEEGAPEGHRGILIDFDMAIRVDSTPEEPLHFRTGTLAFQSVAVLCAGEWKDKAPPQDHLDDLESYFYALAWLCHKYDGTKMSLSPRHIAKWEDPEICSSTKFCFLGVPTLGLPPYFQTPIFKTLLTNLGELCEVWAIKKTKLVCKSTKFPPLHVVHEADKLTGAKDHDKFLAIIDAALEAQRRESEEGQGTDDVSNAPQSKPAEDCDDNTSLPGRCVPQKRPAPDPVPLASPAPPLKRLKTTGCVLIDVANVGVRRSARLAKQKPKPQ